MPWPADAPNVAALCAEDAWPLPSGLADRLIFAHALEHSAHPDRLLEEAVRVLAPDGRILVVTPNRTGLWARRDQTPFGHGRPYSAGQMCDLLEDCGLTVARTEAALFAAPSHRRYWLRMAPALERLGRRFVSDAVAGALVIEAHKRTFARPKAAPQHTPVFLPTAGPTPAAATRDGAAES